MMQINTLSGALLQSTQIQLQQAAEKGKQARKQQELAKNVAARDDEMEHQVENSEELTDIHEQSRQSEQKRKRQQEKSEEEESAGDEDEGLDLTA
ncbi:MAG TPA: hypothetical protein VL992_05215 [Tepidisphaeraceae bacterium]|nr:hypothetical protein [Tepidisphaeraceae bacterium]